MFYVRAIVAIVGTCCISELGQQAKTSPAAVPATVKEIEESKVADVTALHNLATVVAEIHFDAVTLSDAMDWMRDMSEANIFVNWKELESSGVSRNTSISLALKGERLSTILQRILDLAGTEREKLAFRVVDGILTVDTVRDFARNTVTRVYDIRPLVDGPSEQGLDARAKSIEAVEKFFMNQIEPGSWRERGGDIGDLRELQGHLIITQTTANQERIAALLKNLIELKVVLQPASTK